MLTALTLRALKYFCVNHGDQRNFSIWNHHKCLCYSFYRFIWIPMLCVYAHCKLFYSYSAVLDFRRQNLKSTDVRFWRLKSIPALQRLRYKYLCHAVIDIWPGWPERTISTVMQNRARPTERAKCADVSVHLGHHSYIKICYCVVFWGHWRPFLRWGT